VLGLLAELARERPLLRVVDDAHWLDHVSAQALGFAARRLVAESVALVFAVRHPHGTPELAGMAQLTVEGLPETDARTLLESASLGRIDARIVDRVVAEVRGNPNELNAVAEATRTPIAAYGALLLAAWRGLADDAVKLIDTAEAECCVVARASG